VAVELDGGQYNFAKHMEYDQIRTNILEKVEIKVLRYWDNAVLQDPDGVLDDILEELDRHNEHFPVNTPHLRETNNSLNDRLFYTN
jgi:very-short-patch-repair endonuclease